MHKKKNKSTILDGGLTSALRNTEKWFGVADDGESQQQVWHRRSLRHCSQRFGKLKVQYREPDTASSFDQALDSPATQKMPKVLETTQNYSISHIRRRLDDKAHIGLFSKFFKV